VVRGTCASLAMLVKFTSVALARAATPRHQAAQVGRAGDTSRVRVESVNHRL
jgi:hypothetical protein